MKSLVYSSCLVFCLLTINLQGQTVLSDDFSGSTINTSLWQVSTPFSDSSMTESGGYAVFQNRGRLLSVASMPTDINITGEFEFTGNIHDDFTVETRTTGVSSNPYGYFDQGIIFSFAIENDNGSPNNINIIDADYPTTGGTYLASGSYSLSLDTLYDFQITDDGDNLALYIENMTAPLLTASDPAVYGNQLALFNREGAGGGSSISAGSVTQLAYIDVQAVPEPSTTCLALIGGFGFCLVRWRKTQNLTRDLKGRKRVAR